MKIWVLAVLAGGVAALGQDTRVVTEPVIPAACVKLPAMLASAGDKVAEADEDKLDTARIQAAMDGCKPGHGSGAAGRRGGKNAFFDGAAGAAVRRDAAGGQGGDAVRVARPGGVRDARAGHAGGRAAEVRDEPAAAGDVWAGNVRGRQGQAIQRRGGCRPLISATNVTNAAIMGDGTIDGRGYAKLKGHDFSWWEMARKAEPKNDIYYSTRLLVANKADGLILYRITLHNSPNFHVSVGGTNGFTAWGVHLLTPTDRTLDARNTDGIDPGNSTNVTVAHSWIDNGDDNIAIKSGTTHMSVLDNHFYTGHGMSIGSETVGQAYLLVDGLTEDHTSSGIRIKSNVTRGGSVHDLTYRNICMRGGGEPDCDLAVLHEPDDGGVCGPGLYGDEDSGLQADRAGECDQRDAGGRADRGAERRASHADRAAQRDGGRAIKAAQVHLAYADIVTVPPGTNLERSAARACGWWN